MSTDPMDDLEALLSDAEPVPQPVATPEPSSAAARNDPPETIREFLAQQQELLTSSLQRAYGDEGLAGPHVAYALDLALVSDDPDEVLHMATQAEYAAATAEARARSHEARRKLKWFMVVRRIMETEKVPGSEKPYSWTAADDAARADFEYIAFVDQGIELELEAKTLRTIAASLRARHGDLRTAPFAEAIRNGASCSPNPNAN